MENVSKNVIDLILGDWSDDGHGKTSTIKVRCNVDCKVLQEAYNSGTKIIGFDLENDIATEYEDNHIAKEYVDALVARGFVFHDSSLDAEDNVISIWHDDFAAAYMFIAQLGNPEIKYEVVHNAPSINIGGYGLFY